MTASGPAVQHHRVALDGVTLHYAEAGQGPLVILLHGFPETWWSWRHQVEPLAAAGFRVVAPDLRGYGESDLHGPYDLDTTTQDVVRLIDRLGGGAPVALVGHDWGGALAWHLASFHPRCVERLCVLNCPHPALLRTALLGGSRRQMRRSWYMYFFQLPLLPELALTWRGGANVRKTMRAVARRREHFTDEELEPARQAMLRPGAARAAVGWYRAALRDAVPWSTKARRGYPQIPAPVTLLWGMADGALGYDDVVPGTERYAPTLTVERFEGVGHFPQVEAPEQVTARLLAWLGRR